MLLKKRTIAGGLIIIGAVLGTFMSGLLPGFGSGSPALFQEPASNEPATSRVASSQPAAIADLVTPVVVLEVRIENHNYLVPDHSAAGYRQVNLDELVKLAQSTTGNDDGIRVRIVRTKSARLVSWSTLYDALEKSGLPRDSIRMPKELVN
ncbi:MAG: hypothetical protein O3B86_01360 [Planctomycetota bacterium]|nr:hypothetical protein [Planctomycetota bacterium]